MKRAAGRAPLGAVLWGVVLGWSCGSLETEPAVAEEVLGTHEAAVCAGTSVSSLTIAGASTYLGEMAGSGSWAVGSPANAVRLEYYVDGVLYSVDERPTPSGTWYFSATGVACGTHTLLVKAFPMVIDSAGNRTTCFSTSKTASRSVTENCPPLYWSANGPISGKQCTQIIEVSDPHSWNNNYLCADVNYGFKWSSAGPISGMRCTRLIESAEPAAHTWTDNYLCVPTDSPLQLSWSSSAPIAGKQCVQLYEPADPHTWNDNYLCY